MASSLAHVVPDLPRKRVAKASLRGEGPRNFLADLNLGPVIERMVALSGMSKDQAAREMGYDSASTLSRWVSNQEAPNLVRIWGAPRLHAAFLAALAEDAGQMVESETVIRIRRRVA